MGAAAVDRVKRVPGVVDVTTDRDVGGLQVNVIIDRQAAARLGVRVQDIDNSLNNSFSQRQISTIYGPRNQYRVILEVDRKYQRDPSDLNNVYVTGSEGKQVPLSAVTAATRQHADYGQSSAPIPGRDNYLQPGTQCSNRGR